VRLIRPLIVGLLLASCGRTSLELREPIPLERLPALEAELGVRIVGFQHRHPGTHTTLTVGDGREPGETWEMAIERHRRTNVEWARIREEHLMQTEASGAGPDERALDDFRAQVRHLEAHGALVYLIYVEGPLEALRARGHGAIAR
jgi:hypothetical protein